ncbi:hypothetical protein ETAA8_26590 [Anatilimnocola aggregata]|uniref:Uncharacterized protein n=1 Tax=Anatilimnocola aggregata TaxID=2528021 RepID=A0A517YBH5_9BACT|nr:hypothetical protein [Anatilimnocola aggregata]QDU27571.1 hypothetical protein ETAA8_26590 [Anatilimnocola aggregata]
MSQWAEFLRKLNPAGTTSLVAIWRMSDGKSLIKLIPPAELIGEEELAADPEFNYKLYETLELEFDQQTPGQGSGGAFGAAELEAIEQAARTSGLIYRRKPERIIVRSPYTC